MSEVHPIRRLRWALQLSGPALGFALGGYSSSAVYGWERGAPVPPAVAVLISLLREGDVLLPLVQQRAAESALRRAKGGLL